MATLANEKENKKKSMRISLGIHLLLLLIAFLFVLPMPNPKPEPYAVQVEFTFTRSSLSKYAKSDPGKARPKTKKVEKVATVTPKPIEVKKPDIKTPERPKQPIETKPTDPVVTDVIQEESPIEAIEEEIEIDVPEPEEIYEEELEEVPEEVFEEVPEVAAPSNNDAPVDTEEGGEVASNEDGDAEGPPSALEGEENGSGKSNTGTGDGASSGNDGDEGLGDTGAGLGEYDDSGDGVFGRRVIYRNLKGLFSTKLATGKTVMKICINRQGIVGYAEVIEATETNRRYLKKILEAAKGYKYEPDPTAPKEQCGKLTVDLDIQALRGG